MEKLNRPIEVGDLVESVILDRGALAPSFGEYAQEIKGQPPFSQTFGIGIEFTDTETRTDADLARFFKNFKHVTFHTPEMKDSAGRAIEDLIQQSVADFKTTELYKSNPAGPWQLYGEFSISSVTPEALAENRETNHVDDELSHVDFIPPEGPCVTYFGSSEYPTEFREGQFIYRGNTISNYADGASPIPAPSPAEKFPSGHLIRCEDSRTALHAGKFPDEGYTNRVLTRLYIAEKK